MSSSAKKQNNKGQNKNQSKQKDKKEKIVLQDKESQQPQQQQQEQDHKEPTTSTPPKVQDIDQLPVPIRPHEPSEKEIALREENEGLKAELKELEDSLTAIQVDLNKSFKMRERFESLAKVLESRTNEIKAESHAKMQAAEDQSKDIAQEVSSNMGYMQNINQNLTTVSNESVLARKENEGLADQVGSLKQRYDEREKLLQEELNEAHNGLITAQTELARTKLRNAEEKEKFFADMQKVASGLVQSKQEMKDAKETELGLRVLLKKYDEKFGGLQTALEETNSSYDQFRGEMDKMGAKTKELEKEATQWQARWEESNTTLLAMTRNHEVLQRDLQQIHDNLVRMTNLCKVLQQENSALEKKLEAKTQPQPVAK